jgi:hypothetical protein
VLETIFVPKGPEPVPFSLSGGVMDIQAGGTVMGNGSTLLVNEATVTGGGLIDADVLLETDAQTIERSVIAPGGAGSIGSLSITGQLTTTADSNLVFDIHGSSAGAFDQLLVGSAELDGELTVQLLHRLPLVFDQEYLLIDVLGSLTSEFNTLSEGAVVAESLGMELKITYAGGDGNDVVLYTVPEPAALVFLLAGLLGMRLRR